MTYIIHGATGAQGAPVLQTMQAQGIAATAAVRRLEAQSDPQRAVAVDYASVDSLAQAYQGAQGVFVHLPLGSPEQQRQYAVAIAEAVRQAKPPRVVMSTSGYQLQPQASGDDAVNLLARQLQDSGVSVAIVEPRLFLENLLLPVIMDAVMTQDVLKYPLRTDYSVSWSSHLDVAEVVARLLVDSRVTGVVGVGALPGLTGNDLARGFSTYFGRNITFESLEPAAFGELITPMFGAGAAPVVASYEWRKTQPDEVIAESSSAQHLVGIQPRRVEQWLTEVNK